jgi:hypothetical protein
LPHTDAGLPEVEASEPERQGCIACCMAVSLHSLQTLREGHCCCTGQSHTSLPMGQLV